MCRIGTDIERQLTVAIGESLDERPAREPSVMNGELLFRSTCTRCHGMQGRGDGPVARAGQLKPPPADLTDSTLLAGTTPLDLYRKISFGVPGTKMRSFGEALSREERWDAIAYGAVTDALGDVRPGMTAADRHHIHAPLLEAGLSKVEVRMLARRLALRVWDKPQSACLASRIPHGSEVTVEKLKQVERGEAVLREKLGLRVVRLRHEGVKARIEVAPSDVARLLRPEEKEAVLAIVQDLGFAELEIDPRGYRRADPLPQED